MKMVSQVLTYVAVLLAAGHVIESEDQGYGPLCLSCNHVTDVKDCQSTSECWPYETCFGEKVMNASGSEWFNFGCKSREACKLIEDTESGPVRRFEIELRTCQQCCDGNLCNAYMCHENHDFTPCFACSGIAVPQTCDGISLCPISQSCFAQKYIEHGLHPVYDLGCAPHLVCGAIGSIEDDIIGRRSVNREMNQGYSATYLCQRCCNDTGCNADVCDVIESTTSSTATPAENVTSPIMPNTTTEVENITATTSIPIAADCWELREVYNVVEDGEYLLQHPEANETVSAWCDMETDGGGWTVFQRRVYGNVSFDRNWTEFEKGFGELSAAFWWGNENIYAFTKDEPMSMRVDLRDVDGDTLFADYGNFSLTNSSDFYRLQLGGYRGSVGKLMYFFDRPDEKGTRHAGQQFTTKDVDNDKWAGNCAVYTGGGYWLNECCIACLNGKYRQINTNLCMGTVIGDQILHCVQQTEMKFRPASAPSSIQEDFTDPPRP